VAAGRLTKAQETEMLNGLKDRITNLVNSRGLGSRTSAARASGTSGTSASAVSTARLLRSEGTRAGRLRARRSSLGEGVEEVVTGAVRLD
jgi:hypothetical protein